MNSNKKIAIDNNISYVVDTLSKYKSIFIDDKKNIISKEVATNRFLENDIWNYELFKDIPQFSNANHANKRIIFNCKNLIIKNELKFIVYNKIFTNEWGFHFTQNRFINIFLKFISQKHPTIKSILNLDFKKTKLQWLNFIIETNLQTKKIHTARSKIKNQKIYVNSQYITFFKSIYVYLGTLLDFREEWEKERWDVRNLVQYGIKYNQTRNDNYINFSKINNSYFREITKKYIKQRLISNNKFSWSSATNYLQALPIFFNFISNLYPNWNNLNFLERSDIENYLAYLSKYSESSSHKEEYIRKNLIIISKFLTDIQLREYSIAPYKNVRILIYSSDKPVPKKKPYDKIDYITDYVLEQIFDNINNLHNEVIPIVYIMFKTGLRISDVLSLTDTCLIRLNNEFWIETDVEKTYVEGHRIPIDTELANIISVLINKSQMFSNDYNNPNKFIFIRYNGKRKGLPYSQRWILEQLYLFAVDYNIKDENGYIYKFKNHAFRHTYAIKMLNGGADILTVQELLAHASPEMTMRYAKLLDDTKRKTFDKAVKQGIFSFDEGDKLKEENNGEIPTNILDMLYTNHKLNALDTPYGTCIQRKNGKCSFAKQPPCLTCNGGNPCKDLCVGAFEGDMTKYEILINSTKTMIENAKIYNRTEMINENEELLKLYEDIYYKISQGNLIYSRLDKLKRKGDTINE